MKTDRRVAVAVLVALLAAGLAPLAEAADAATLEPPLRPGPLEPALTVVGVLLIYAVAWAAFAVALKARRVLHGA